MSRSTLTQTTVETGSASGENAKWQYREKSSFQQRVAIKNSWMLIAIDASGSTISTFLTDKSIFNIEKRLAYELGYGLTDNRLMTRFCSWSGICSQWKNDLNDIPLYGGGTRPQSIFENNESMEHIDIFTLITDGYIHEDAINQFNKYMHLLPEVVILIIVTNEEPNVSVIIAPFAAKTHAIAIQCCGLDSNAMPICKVIESKGAFANFHKDTFIPNIQTLRDVEYRKLPRLPIGVICSNDVTFYPERLMNTINADITITRELLSDVRIWAQVNEKWELYRKWLNNCIIRLDEELQQITISSNTSQLINRIRTLNAELESATGDTSAILEELKQFRLQLAQERMRTAIEINTTHKQIMNRIKSRRALYYEALSKLAEMQKSNYGASAIDRKSRGMGNRAVRAGEDVEQLSILQMNPDFTDSPTGMCQICLGQDHIVLQFVKVDGVMPDGMVKADKNNDDFALNFPLALGKAEHNRNVFTPLITCLQCARAIHGQLDPLGRREVTSMFPVCQFYRNKEIWYRTLELAFYARVPIHNVNPEAPLMLLISILAHAPEWAKFPADALDVIKSKFTNISLDDPQLLTKLTNIAEEYMPTSSDKRKWLATLQTCIRQLEMHNIHNFIKEQILTHCKTYPNLKEAMAAADEKVSLRKALLHVITLDVFWQQPFYAQLTVLLLIKTHRIGNVTNDQIDSLLQRAYMRQIVRTACANDKRNQWNLIRQSIISSLWDTRFGIPIRGTGRLVQEFPQLLNLNAVHELSNCKPIPKHLTKLLMYLLEVQPRQFSSDELIAHFRRQLYGAAIFDIGRPSIEFIDEDVIRELNTHPIVDRGEFDAAHRVPPPFVTTLGPSVLKCVCGFSFISLSKEELREKFSNDIGGIFLMRMAQHVRKVRAEHFMKVHNTDNANPGQRGRLYNLHLGVRRAASNYTLEQIKLALKYQDEKLINDCIQCIINDRGYITYEHIEKDIQTVLPSLVEAMEREGKTYLPPPSRDNTLEDKLFLEVNL